VWGNYVEAHPALLLTYAASLPEIAGRTYFERWWKLRGDAVDLSPSEIEAFYALAPRWGRPEDFASWMKVHAALETRDFRRWAALLHGWREDDRAWQIFSAMRSEPQFPAKVPDTPRERLETTWRTTPQNFVNAQQLAFTELRAGDQAASDNIIITVARGANPPQWFVEKAAWILARAGRSGEAVSLLLQSR
jgi:hypothetical protein